MALSHPLSASFRPLITVDVVIKEQDLLHELSESNGWMMMCLESTKLFGIIETADCLRGRNNKRVSQPFTKM